EAAGVQLLKDHLVVDQLSVNGDRLGLVDALNDLERIPHPEAHSQDIGDQDFHVASSAREPHPFYVSQLRLYQIVYFAAQSFWTKKGPLRPGTIPPRACRRRRSPWPRPGRRRRRFPSRQCIRESACGLPRSTGTRSAGGCPGTLSRLRRAQPPARFAGA